MFEHSGVPVLRFPGKVLKALAMAAVGAAAMCSGLAPAQGAPVVARPVVQALPNPANGRLKEALARLGRNPRDVAALMDAGDAALALEDFDAAIGFYRRADEISPDSARIKAGFARAYTMNGDPVSAIPYFDAAERAGADVRQVAADRGLAYDLVGDNATAQRYYATAMAAGESDQVRMRLALSQAMAGNQKAAEVTLMPLLRKQDKPGWRTRAFALAIGGDIKQAVSVANTILPPQLAENIAPYLRYMPRLTRAQQAAAANLGRFPRASEIGRDDSRIAAYAPPRLAAADHALVPKGEPLDGRGARKTPAPAIPDRARIAAAKAGEAQREEAVRKATATSGDPDRVAPPDPRPTIESGDELPPVSGATRATPVATHTLPPAAAVAKASPPQAQVPAVPPRTEATSSGTVAPAAKPAPGFDLAALQSPQGQAPAASPPASSAASAPTAAGNKAASPAPAAGDRAASPAPVVARPPSLSEAFAELGKPTLQAAPAAGAVDIRKIAAVRAAAKVEEKPAEKAKPKKPAPPAHPSRIWVQIGVGRDKDAIAFDWRRYAKQAPALFKGRQANVSEMGRTNRVLAGPFETLKAADQFVTALKKAGIEGAMPWTSPAGQVVDPLPGK